MIEFAAEQRGQSEVGVNKAELCRFLVKRLLRDFAIYVLSC